MKTSYFLAIICIITFEIATGDTGQALVAGVLGFILSGFLD